MASLPAIQVANTFINRFSADRVDHLKLQKLVYYSYGWWLALRPADTPFTDVKPQVWKLGPVFRPIYAAFAGSRSQPISEMKSIGPFEAIKYIERTRDDEHSQLVDWIWQKYGGFSGTELSDMTHEEGTPWYNIAKKHNFVVPRFFDMDDDENRAYFNKLAKGEGILQ